MCDVLQLVVDRLNDGPLAQRYLASGSVHLTEKYLTFAQRLNNQPNNHYAQIYITDHRDVRLLGTRSAAPGSGGDAGGPHRRTAPGKGRAGAGEHSVRREIFSDIRAAHRPREPRHGHFHPEGLRVRRAS